MAGEQEKHGLLCARQLLLCRRRCVVCVVPLLNHARLNVKRCDI